MKSLLVVLLTVPLFALYSDGAAVKTQAVKSPIYDEDFMRKLCAFLGATYVRSAKDPMCWYTWCHNGEPYHMQCPPGRAVSKHFYWSSDDPCTENDSNEQCLVGYLKNMHLENQGDEDEFEKQEDPEIVVESPKAHRRVDHADNVVNNEDDDNADEEFDYEGNYYESPRQSFGERQAPLLTADGHEPEPEPVPEIEPEHKVSTKEEVIVKKIEADQNEDNVYFPEQHRAHIVEAFVPKDPVPLYGGYRRYNGPFHYFPQKFYPAPTRQQPTQKPEYLGDDEENEEPVERVMISTTSEPHYFPPMARSARLIGSQMAMAEAQRQQRLFGLDDFNRDYRQPVDYRPEFDYQPEYIYEDGHHLTTPKDKDHEAVHPTVENRMEHENEISNQDEGVIEAAEVISKKADPVVYDYFKTHFVEEV